MAEANSSSGSKGFARALSKKVFRTKEKVLQNLGKADKTTDDVFDVHVSNLAKQQVVASKLHKELKNYMLCSKAMSAASKSFYDTVQESYEEEWTGYPELVSAVEQLTILWEDYLMKMTDEIHMPLTTYLGNFPIMKSKIAKRGRKLVDYDSARHNFQSLLNAKKRDETKIAKAQDELDEARQIYDEINTELNDELPRLFASRIHHLSTAFCSLFNAQSKFDEESGKLRVQLADMTDKLASDSSHQAFVLSTGSSTPRRREHMSNDKDGQPAEGNTGRSMSTFYTPRQSNTPSSSSSSNSTPQTSHRESGDSTAKAPPVAVSATPVAAPMAAPRLTVSVVPKENTSTSEPSSSPPNSRKYDLQCATTNGSTSEKMAGESESQDDNEVEHSYEPVTIGAQIEPRLSGEVMSEGTSEDPSVEEDDHDIYHTPRSNAPINQLASGVLFQVQATHPYAGEDVDELSFEPGDIINVIPFDDPEDQDEGWLMGVKVEGGGRGVFPENFTKPV
ncbi:Myc box-dependent-interacting protein 1 [Lamellibrachia satsuma]|nr:Myc box-dependent-interacting protein 1 [Lamellibrachia satsuma]